MSTEIQPNFKESRYKQVYYVEYLDSKAYPDPIAICPFFNKDSIGWEDTGRGRMFKLIKARLQYNEKEEKNLPNRIDIDTIDGKQLSLIKLTLDIYNQRVRSRVYGQPEFKNDQELQNYYLTTSFM